MTITEKKWVDVPGWPRAHLSSGPSGVFLVLTDELDASLPNGPHWLVVCPYCKTVPFAVARTVIAKGRKGRSAPSCGCRKPGTEQFTGDYRKIGRGDTLFS